MRKFLIISRRKERFSLLRGSELYMNKFVKLDERDKFLEKYSGLKLTHDWIAL